MYEAARIYKDPGFEIAPLRRGFPKGKKQHVIGFDTEAEGGEPYLLQVAHPGDEVILFDVDGHSILETLLKHLNERCIRRDTTYTLFGFHLSYEYTQLFGALPPSSWGYSEILYDGGWYELYVYNEKRFTFLIKFGKGRTIRVLDAMAFIPASLKEASRLVDVGEKYEAPPTFAKSQRHDPDFVRYAQQDAILTQRLGEYVVGLHREQDVPLSLSASHFAAQVFRRRYLKDSVPRPSEELEQLGLECYHGGKNAYYNEEPDEWPTAHAYDIRSAYSEGMASLPDIESGVWYPTHDLRPHSINHARIRYHGCKYQPLWGLSEPADLTVATTGYELASALRCGCTEIYDLDGYELRGDEHGSLWRYVQDFYDMKRHATSGAQKVAAKLFLNGLYGKFFQKVPIGKAATYKLDTGEYQIRNDDGVPYDYIAGGLYHPPIAALITGFVRAKVHELEHRYRAIMTSTDGIFATQGPLASDVGDELGNLESSTGRLRVWRERLYIFDPTDGSRRKVAKHGFRGKVEQLEKIPLQKGVWEYGATVSTTLRMAMRGKHRPGEFVAQPYHVEL